jgi:NAD(P)-dependent dehydrogenase (short-subunit alcohol dehydrogenase family)
LEPNAGAWVAKGADNGFGNGLSGCALDYPFNPLRYPLSVPYYRTGLVPPTGSLNPTRRAGKRVQLKTTARAADHPLKRGCKRVRFRCTFQSKDLGIYNGGSMQLTGRVALVTGASSGIGKAAAIVLAKAGAKVGLLARRETALAETMQTICAEGGEALPLVADISQPEQVKTALDRLAQHWGRLDIVFANAGINGMWAPVEEIEPEEWDETMAVNLKGTFLTVKYAVPYMKESGGSIIIDSSVNGTRMFSNSGFSAYATSKGAQVAFAKMIAVELARYRIRVNVICPGAITTEIGRNTRIRNFDSVRKKVKYLEGCIPLTKGTPGKAEQVAQLVLFLASDMSDHITGTEIWIDGAQSLYEG